MKLLSRHDLKNGLVLEFYDRSRPVAGDRWQVVVEARVKVGVTGANLPPDLRGQASQVIAALGEETVFAKEEVRNFVADEEMAGMLAEIEKQLLSSLSAYLGHPEFAARFLRKKFADYLQARSWQQ